MNYLITLLRSVRTQWRGATTVAPRSAMFPIERPVPRVPAAYRALYTYLEGRYASVVVLTFEQMEALLGCALPAPACTEPGWWANDDATGNPCSETWIAAGRVATPNFAARTVTFERRP